MSTLRVIVCTLGVIVSLSNVIPGPGGARFTTWEFQSVRPWEVPARLMRSPTLTRYLGHG